MKINKNRFQQKGVTALNSAKADKEKCTWNCHNDTNFCKKHHVKMRAKNFEYTDPIYFGVIHSLKSTGHYVLANIIFLVVLIPILIVFLIGKSISIQFKIRAIKKENG
ncbi:MAG: hypothetical protein ACJAYJ_001330 [Saprospiraceae bacterium]